MLSVEDNELLTRVGKGQPMGELLSAPRAEGFDGDSIEALCRLI